MAVTVVGTPTAYKANNTTFQFTHTTIAGTDALFVGTGTDSGTITAVTADGAAMTQVTGAAGTWNAGSGAVSIWVKRSPTIGAITIAITTTSLEISAGACNFSGVNITSDATAATGGATASASSNSPSVNAGGSPTASDLLFDVATWSGTDVTLVGADQTQQTNASSGDFRSTTATSTQAGNISPATMSWTLNDSVAWGAATCIVTAAAAASSPPMFRGS